jgi:hypothetical protein
MSDQYRDICVDRRNKNRGKEDPIRVSFYDKDGIRINDVTRKEANCIATQNPKMLFYFQDGNGYQRELLIPEVNALKLTDKLPNDISLPVDAQLCGPPRVQIFGANGMAAEANAIVSPISSSVIGFDIINSGFNFTAPPFVQLVDECGNGSGGSLFVQTEPYTGKNDTGKPGPTKGGLQIKNIVIAAPGDGYLAAPNGSKGGNGRVVIPAPVTPDVPQDLQLPGGTTYKVLLCLDEIYVEDGGFGYIPGDTAKVIPENGSSVELVINQTGEITQIKVLSKGCGYTDLPEIVIESQTGYNAKLYPVLSAKRITDEQTLFDIPPEVSLISVIDCVGKIAPKSEFDRVPR